KAQALPTNDAQVVVAFLKKLFCRFRMPKALISDQGKHDCVERIPLDREFLNPKKKREIESWLEDNRIIDSLDGSNEIEYFDTFPTLEELEYHEWLLKYPKPSWDTTSIIDHHLRKVVFGKPFARKTGLVYDQEKGMVTFEKDNEKITFKMPHKMEAFNHIDYQDVNTDSIPPFVLESNDDRGKSYYSDSLTLRPEYREDKSISKEIRHLMKLEREAKRHKGEVT
ncbi:hypothetical protein Tco_1178855, partial [Tanacetum coccineum]